MVDPDRIKELETRLKRTEELLEGVLNGIGEGIIVVDGDFKILSANEGYLDRMGMGKDEVIGNYCYRISHKRETPCSEKEHHCPVRETYKTGKPARTTHIHYDRNGKEIFVEVNSYPILDASGQVKNVIESVVDITEQVELEKELHHSYKKLEKAYNELKALDSMKDEFISNVSHELKTPITSIRGFTELLYDGKLGDTNEKQKEALDVIIKNIDRLTRLIDNLLDLSAIRGKKMEFEFHEVPLGEVLRETLDTVRNSAKSKGLSLIYQVPGNLPPVWGDRDRLVQVFTNVLDNAVKFTPQGGDITVKVAEKGDLVETRIKDTGYGMPEGKIPRLFDQFFQVDASLTRKVGGAGLGLFITKNIVDGHEGRIKINSKPGNGTEVIITLPKTRW
jgi:PAS domain S-box-containing protein